MGKSMTFRTSLRVHNRNQETLTLVVEPWAAEFDMVMGEECDVVAVNRDVVPSFGVESCSGGLIVWINEGGSTFEFWRAGVLAESMPVPIPGYPLPKSSTVNYSRTQRSRSTKSRICVRVE